MGAVAVGVLSEREIEILRLIAQDLSHEEIAGRLFKSPHTIREHKRHILTKLHARTMVGAVATAVREGIIE